VRAKLLDQRVALHLLPIMPVPSTALAARLSSSADGSSDAGMTKYYWEDFKVGDRAPMGERVMDKDEMIAFASAFDPQPFHVDEEAARESVFGGLIASGWHTVAVVMRMIVDSYLRDAAGLGSPGVDNVRWLKPVRPGDRIRAQREVVETRASKSRPDMGLVRSRWEAFNQDGEQVMTMEGYGMFRRRHPGREED
jgi:acyl dehydratase